MLASSVLLLRVASSRLYFLENFSRVHNLHLLVTLEYDCALSRIFHLIV